MWKRRIVVVLWLASVAAAQCANFSPGPQDLTWFDAAVIRVRVISAISKGTIATVCSDEKNENAGTAYTLENSGTGYIIDSTSGYVITAEHVIDNATVNQKAVILGTNQKNLVGKCLTLKVVQALRDKDLALLKIENPGGLDSLVLPLDISFRVPRLGAGLYFSGYPSVYDGVPNSDLQHQTVTIQNSGVQQIAPGTIAYLISGGKSVFVGESGGPLIDASGAVLGTETDKVGTAQNGVAYFVPSIDTIPLLDLIPLSPRIEELQTRALAGAVTSVELEQLLQKGPKHPNNLELYSWIREAMKQKSTGQLSKFIPCPLAEALYDRGLDDLAFGLAKLAPSEATARNTKVGAAALSVAYREFSYGHLPGALDAADIAVKVFQGTTTNGERLPESLLLRGEIYFARKDYPLALADLHRAEQTSAHASQMLRFNILEASGDVFNEKGDRATARIKFMHALEEAADDAASLQSASEKLVNVSLGDNPTELALTADALEKTLERLQSISFRDELKPAQAEIIYQLARIEIANSHTGRAQSYLTKYLSLAPMGIHAAEAASFIEITADRSSATPAADRSSGHRASATPAADKSSDKLPAAKPPTMPAGIKPPK